MSAMFTASNRTQQEEIRTFHFIVLHLEKAARKKSGAKFKNISKFCRGKAAGE
jgi:hypothetical protein